MVCLAPLVSGCLRCEVVLLVLAVALLLPPPLAAAGGDSDFGEPSVVSTSATCAAVEFPYSGETLSEVFVFAKQPGDLEFLQWGLPLPVRAVGKDSYSGTPKYRFLMRELPPDSAFKLRLSDTATLDGGVSASSEEVRSQQAAAEPVAPSDLQIHRTDLRLNKQRHDDSVCVDLHWSHPHGTLHQSSDDVYFKIRWNTIGEQPFQFCEDTVGDTRRNCGIHLNSVSSGLPSSYTTICGLRPNRTVNFEVQAFTCDGSTSSSHLQALTPGYAPNAVMTLVTHPANQESFAGFRPLAVLDWVPQQSSTLVGHAVYLGLRQLSAYRLLCFVPHHGAKGQLAVPIRHQNHTYSEDTLLIRDFWNQHEVHQEEELVVATRFAVVVNGARQDYYIESPATSHRLGNWLVLTEEVKCLTSFEAKHPEYVTQPVIPAWTQEEALTMYD